MNPSSATPTGEDNLYRRIRELVIAARQTVARGVDLVQVRTNFQIGRHIVEHEQQGKRRAAYGREVIKQLAERLASEFGDGFSARNLASMRTFFLCYRDRSPSLQTLSANSLKPSSPVENLDILQTASAKYSGQEISQTVSGQSARPFSLSWSHYVFLLGIKNPDERSFYEIEATSESWTLRELKRQFDSGLYERLALSRDKEGIRQLAREGQIVSRIPFALSLSKGCY
ncbi:MAG: DUF1016 N-terminal domain-containing protein [Rhodocyclaceae bacterium]|nr:DUF1016 N-terminal domain-containing protein [Rhodocyclaceae bacterium]